MTSFCIPRCTNGKPWMPKVLLEISHQKMQYINKYIQSSNEISHSHADIHRFPPDDVLSVSLIVPML